MQVPFLSKIKGEKHVAIFDVGSGSIAGGLATVSKGGAAKVYFSQRSLLSYEDRTEEQRVSALTELIKEVGSKVSSAQSKLKIVPSEVLVSIHAPWVTSATYTNEQEFENSQKISSNDVKTCAKKASKSDESKSDLAAVIEKSVVRVELNGYPTPDPVGKDAQAISVTVIESKMHSALHKQVDQVLKNQFSNARIVFRSATIVDTTLLQTYAPTEGHYTVADVTSESTALTVIRDGVISDYQVVPIGARSLVQAIAREKKISDEDALSRVRMFVKDECSTDECKSISIALEAAGGACTEGFGKVFAEIVKNKRLPNVLVLKAQPDLAKWFASFFSRLDFSQFTETTKPFEVLHLSHASFAERLIFIPGVSPDSGIAAGALFVHTSAD